MPQRHLSSFKVAEKKSRAVERKERKTTPMETILHERLTAKS